MSSAPPTSAYRIAALALGLATSRTATRDEAERRLRLLADADTASGAREVLDRLRDTDPHSARRARDLLDRAVPAPMPATLTEAQMPRTGPPTGPLSLPA